MTYKTYKSYRNLGQFIKKAAKKYQDKVFLKTEKEGVKISFTYREIFEKACQFANYLESKDVLKGDRVAIWGSNSPEWVISYFGCLVYGAAAVPIDLRTTTETISHFFKTARPVLWVKGTKGTEESLGVQEIYFEDLEGLISGFSKNRDLSNVEGENLAEIVYTSGTTGEPKGAAISHGGMLAGINSLINVFPLKEGWKILSIFPLSHLFEEAIGLFMPMSAGATIFYLQRLTSVSVVKAFREEKITCMIVVPEFLRFLEKTVERRANKLLKIFKVLNKSLSFRLRRLIFFPIHRQFGGSLEFFVSSGAPLERKVRDFFETMGIKVYEGYGSTEMLGVSVDIDHQESGSVGRILEGVEIRVSEEGELLVKSPSLFKGYFGDAEKTAKVFTDGFYHSGDCGKVKNGYLFLSGRDYYKIVLSSALKVYVEDVERKLYEHPDVVEACVAGVDREEGKRVCGVLIIKWDSWDKGDKRDKCKDIIQKTNRRLEEHQQIMEYYLWEGEDFPRTPLRKIDRKKVESWVEEKAR